MSTLTDQVPDVLSYLVTACKGDPVLTSLGVQVYDGPQPEGTAAGVEQALWIGHNPKAPDEEIGEAEQQFAVLDRARTFYEDGQVICAAKAWDGDTNFADVRAACSAIVAEFSLLLRGDTITDGPGDVTLGGNVLFSQVTGFTWWQSLIAGGAEAYCAFRVSYKARLTT